MRPRISSVAPTPISAEISVNSSSSIRSASMTFLPWMASSRAEPSAVRVCCTPLLSLSRRDGSWATAPNSVWIMVGSILTADERLNPLDPRFFDRLNRHDPRHAFHDFLVLLGLLQVVDCLQPHP